MADPIRPEQVPDSLVATARRATSGWTGMPEGDADLGERPLRFVLAAVLTEARDLAAQRVDQYERIADAAAASDPGHTAAIQARAFRAAARLIRSWPGGGE